jgi:hypothetical protein
MNIATRLSMNKAGNLRLMNVARTQTKKGLTMRKRADHIHFRRDVTIAMVTLIAALMLMITPGLDHAANRTDPATRDVTPILQRSSIAVCGSPTCDCGRLRLVSKTHGPCEATAAAGSCRQGSGMCCVCEGRHSVVACGKGSCDCGATQAPVQVNAPCEVVSPAGACRLGSGVCCICVTP